MSADTDRLAARELLERLCDCDSGEEIRAVIRSWLLANPAGAHPQDGYASRSISPVLDQLAKIAERIVRESGPPGAIDEFDARRWVSEWAHTPHPALGERCPVHLLHTAEGAEQVRKLLEQQQSGAYA